MSDPVKGSWEDYYERALERLTDGDDGAVEQFATLIERLSRLRPAQLAAGDGFLLGMRRDAVLQVMSRYLLAEEYDKAIAWIDRHQPTLGVDAPTFLGYRADILHMIGRDDEAVQTLDRYAESEEGGAEARGQQIVALIRYGQITEAERQIDALVGDAEQEPDEDERNLNLGFSHRLRASTALARKDIPKAISEYVEAIKLDPVFGKSLDSFYPDLIRLNVTGAPLQFIEAEDSKEPHAYFWRGMTQKHEGRPSDAERSWVKGLRRPFEDLNTNEQHYWILCQYALGDPKAQGLAAALETARLSTRPNWYRLVLAAIGSALRGDITAARANLGEARAMYRAYEVQGRSLPHHAWFLCHELLPAATVRELAAYFQTEPTPVT